MKNKKRRAKTTLCFTTKAYTKMIALVNEFDEEVAWHGLAERKGDGYLIYDIIIYPQKVTAATVVTDQEEYQNWLIQSPDEIINNIRMQGHSHVNMGTTPSGTDESLYKEIVKQLEGDMFYIFIIWNKKQERTIWICDKKKGVNYSTKNIRLNMIVRKTEDFDREIHNFIQEAKEKVHSKRGGIEVWI